MSDNRFVSEMQRLKTGQKAMIIASLAYSVAYFVWRAQNTINPGEYEAYSWAFYALDAFGFINSLVVLAATWRIQHRQAPAPTPGRTVDVYIPTFNESPELLRTTIQRALRMEYPHETYVLDDGRRPEVEALAREMGVHYLSRPENKHAKAGNINFALGRTRGELIAVFDADGLARRDFLTKLVGYFDDSNVALVQTPNAFYNLDSFQHSPENGGKSTWHEQALWYDIILRGLDTGNTATWCGSGSMFQRAAIEKVGGVATESVTEDTLTTLKLHLAGFETVYHDEPLSFSLAPTSIEQFLTQRGRWALGSVQILRKHFLDILLSNKLRFKQRLAYLMSLYYFTTFQKLFYYTAPFIYIVFDVAAVTGPVEYAFPLMLYIALSINTFQLFSRGTGRVILSEVYFLHLIPTYLKSILEGLLPFLKVGFKVTSKDPNGMTAFRYWLGPITLCALSFVAMAFGALKMVSIGFDNFTGTSIAMSVSMYYFYIGASSLENLRKTPISKTTYSFLEHRPVWIRSLAGEALLSQKLAVACSISDQAIHVLHPEALEIGAKAGFILDLPNSTLALEGEVRSCSKWGKSDQKLHVAEIRLDPMAREAREALLDYFFEDATPRKLATTAKLVQERPTVVPMRDRQRSAERLPTLVPVTLQPAAVETVAPASPLSVNMGLMLDFTDQGARIQTSYEVQVGSTIQVQMPWIDKVMVAEIKRCMKREDGQVNASYDVGLQYLSREAQLELEYIARFNQFELKSNPVI